MDGSQELFADAKDSDEAARQAKVYANAMKSIRLERQSSERQGYVVMAAMTSTESFSDGSLMKAVRMFLVAFACLMPVFAFWAIAF